MLTRDQIDEASAAPTLCRKVSRYGQIIPVYDATIQHMAENLRDIDHVERLNLAADHALRDLRRLVRR